MHGTIPIIRLEVEGMKHTLTTALMEHSALMDEQLRAAIEAYCTPENIARVVQEAARAALDQAIKESVQNFFRFGPGRSAVAEAVKESLLAKETYTPLDEV